MYRRCIHDLIGALSSGQHKHIYVDGPTGCGKSVALAAAAEWARSAGWLVLYIPSATALTEGGYFIKRPGTAQYDTIISAQHILKTLHDNHKDQLKELPCQLTNGPLKGNKTLLDYCLEGMATDDDAALAVDCALALRDELVMVSQQRKVLFVIDNYNALHWVTDYGAVINKIRRRVLLVEELALASGFRLMARPDMGGATVLAGCTWSRSISPKCHITTVPGTSVVHLPRYSEVEVAHALYYYYEAGLSADVPTHRQVLKMRALTNGNARELRQLLPQMQLMDVHKKFYWEAHPGTVKRNWVPKDKWKQPRRLAAAGGGAAAAEGTVHDEVSFAS